MKRLLTQYKRPIQRSSARGKKVEGRREEFEGSDCALSEENRRDTKKRAGAGSPDRDYDLLRTNYQSLLDKRMQAQMAQTSKGSSRENNSGFWTPPAFHKPQLGPIGTRS